jgi:UDP-N-acetylmuramoylalanine--D-glutamate ligase
VTSDLPAPPFLAPLLQRPVAVLGGGVSGRGVTALLGRLGVRGVVYDEKAAASKSPFPEHRDQLPYFSSREAAGHGLVVYSPGFPPEHTWLRVAKAAGCTCLGELDFASLFWRGNVIAITGTNGKTTLTEFLCHALRQAGRPAHATGNVGYSFSQLAADLGPGDGETAVCEVSSFQAETLQHLRPSATLWTNFAEDHLERHPGMDAYFAAKWRLIERTPAGSVFVGSSVQRYATHTHRTLPASARLATEGQPADRRLGDSVFAEYPQRENFILAAAWWRSAGLPEDALYAAAQSFRIGAHRLARVGEKRGVTFWNDSKATNFHAVEAALGHFAAPVLWIGGGKSKGGDLGGFIARIARRVRHAFLIGETRSALAGLLENHRVPAQLCGTLEEAVRSAFAAARPGDHVLLSPGFASFDMFRGYDDRGRQFESLVGNL